MIEVADKPTVGRIPAILEASKKRGPRLEAKRSPSIRYPLIGQSATTVTTKSEPKTKRQTRRRVGWESGEAPGWSMAEVTRAAPRTARFFRLDGGARGRRPEAEAGALPRGVAAEGSAQRPPAGASSTSPVTGRNSVPGRSGGIAGWAEGQGSSALMAWGKAYRVTLVALNA